MGCHRCGVRQGDPVRGPSPWKRGVVHGRQVLICPGCQAAGDWQAELDGCAACASTRLVRRLDEVVCLHCGEVTQPSNQLVLEPSAEQVRDALGADVSAALDRLFGRA